MLFSLFDNGANIFAEQYETEGILTEDKLELICK
jgi:hypothetical protein